MRSELLFPASNYHTIVADPPWLFSDSLPGGRGSESHYSCMLQSDLKAFFGEEMLGLATVDRPASKPFECNDCRLFLWRVASMQREALDVMDAWGFTLKSEIVWNKLTATGKKHFGMGRQVRMSHETCLIGVRGSPEILSKSVRSTFEARVPTNDGKLIHSAKPEDFFELVESLSPGPYLELFARNTRPGWDCRGDELTTKVEP